MSPRSHTSFCPPHCGSRSRSRRRRGGERTQQAAPQTGIDQAEASPAHNQGGKARESRRKEKAGRRRQCDGGGAARRGQCDEGGAARRGQGWWSSFTRARRRGGLARQRGRSALGPKRGGRLRRAQQRPGGHLTRARQHHRGSPARARRQRRERTARAQQWGHRRRCASECGIGAQSAARTPPTARDGDKGRNPDVQVVAEGGQWLIGGLLLLVWRGGVEGGGRGEPNRCVSETPTALAAHTNALSPESDTEQERSGGRKRDRKRAGVSKGQAGNRKKRARRGKNGRKRSRWKAKGGGGKRKQARTGKPTERGQRKKGARHPLPHASALLLNRCAGGCRAQRGAGGTTARGTLPPRAIPPPPHQLTRSIPTLHVQAKALAQVSGANQAPRGVRGHPLPPGRVPWVPTSHPACTPAPRGPRHASPAYGPTTPCAGDAAGEGARNGSTGGASGAGEHR